ncbi:MAG: sigma-70 family RNA polymerase sigma factor [Kofleriaceae bacterium]
MTADPSDPASSFEPHRAHLRKVAYRMLGSVAEAEDAVQDAFLRWHAVERATVAAPRAFLARIVTRLCLDRLKSARALREQYVGTWLPEPVIEEPADDARDDVPLALLVVLERLSPLERAAFLLHDVLEMEFADVASALDRSEAAVRQLAARARAHVRDARPRFRPSPEEATRLGDAFAAALAGGDLSALSTLLARDVVFYSDGGGKRRAALRPITGRDKILRFFEAILRKQLVLTEDSIVERAWLNGLTAFIVRRPGELETFALEIAGEEIVAIYGMRNPDKLRHLG